MIGTITEADQVVRLYLGSGLDTTPEWVLYNEFVLTTGNVCGPFAGCGDAS